ncbi:hypothetical protein HS7_04720 [Sulfolobales archaeon HS-7]|nr:hypothetical protein HS7_04720 [Sulfolobales archaeon HS-7]
MKLRYIIAGILFVIPLVYYLPLPLYNRVNPELGGLSFFYWYQIVGLLVTTVTMVLGALLLRG